MFLKNKTIGFVWEICIVKHTIKDEINTENIVYNFTNSQHSLRRFQSGANKNAGTFITIQSHNKIIINNCYTHFNNSAVL